MKERIYMIISHYKISARALERMCGLSGGYVKNMRNELGGRKLEDVLNAFPETIREWLTLGTGETLRTPQNAVNILNGNNNTNNGHMSVPETNVEQFKNENEARKTPAEMFEEFIRERERKSRLSYNTLGKYLQLLKMLKELRLPDAQDWNESVYRKFYEYHTDN